MTLYRAQAMHEGIIQHRFFREAEDVSEIWEVIDFFEWPGVSDQARWEVDNFETL